MPDKIAHIQNLWKDAHTARQNAISLDTPEAYRLGCIATKTAQLATLRHAAETLDALWSAANSLDFGRKVKTLKEHHSELESEIEDEGGAAMYFIR